MRKSTFLITLLVALTFSYAQNVVSIQDAKKASLNFIAERVGTTEAKSEPVLTLQQTVTDDAGNPLYYRFQIGNKGFMIVSAVDIVSPVLAFSFESNYEWNSTSAYMLEKYAKGIELVKQHPEFADKDAANTWKHYSAANFSLSNNNTKDVVLNAVEPLTTANWSQERYFNTLCPFNSYVSTGLNWDNRALTGCVAVALSGLLHYYRYPDKGSMGYSYTPEPDNGDGTFVKPFVYPRLTISTANQNFDYNAMTNTVTSYNNEVAKLMYNLGVSVRMMYGAIASGAFSYRDDIDYDAFDQLKAIWKFSPDAMYRAYSDFNNYTTWANQVLKPELDAMHPLYYSAQSNAGGHAWLVDGYIDVDSVTTYYHCNWGWGGSNNGFFKLGAFKAKVTSGGEVSVFNGSESVFTKLVDSAMCANALAKPATSFVRNKAHSGTISDGAGNVKYKPNSNRKWMIAAPNTASYTFYFDKIKTKSGDLVTIYNGPTETSGIAAQYSGNYRMGDASDVDGIDHITVNYPGTPLPAAVTVSKDSVLVTFTSNGDNDTDYGFAIQYTSSLKNSPPSCTISTNLPTSDGTISDKGNMSADQTVNYKPNNFCRWQIIPSGVVNYWVKFDKFDLKAGEYLDIYDISTTNEPQLMVRYDIKNPPAVGTDFVMNCRRMRVDFLVDNKDEGTGFIMNFRAKETGINDIANNLYDVAVYPNPAKDILNVDLTTETTGNINFTIVDMTGKQISSESVKHAGGTMTYTTPVGNLSKGVYFIYILTNQGKTVRKFVVE